MDTAECIASNTCPVCSKQHSGVSARRGLQAHLKRPLDDAHILWFKTQYKDAFPRPGGNMRLKQAVTEQTIVEAIKTTFGAEWAARVSIDCN